MDSNVFTIRLGNETRCNPGCSLCHEWNLTQQSDFFGIPWVNQFILFNSLKGILLFPPFDTFPRIYSRPADSVFIPMMYRSDNFFAEQTLLMVSMQRIHIMKDETIIDTLLNGPLADLPQKPNWVDGSGLSHFNLFTPQDFVTLLIKFKNEFGMDRMKRILPTGGNGTLKNYYRRQRIYFCQDRLPDRSDLSEWIHLHE